MVGDVGAGTTRPRTGARTSRPLRVRPTATGQTGSSSSTTTSMTRSRQDDRLIFTLVYFYHVWWLDWDTRAKLNCCGCFFCRAQKGAEVQRGKGLGPGIRSSTLVQKRRGVGGWL